MPPRAHQSVSRRVVLLSGAAMAGVGLAPQSVRAQPAIRRGGSLAINIGTEPPALIQVTQSAGATYFIGGKINESLLTYDNDFNPQPLLATAAASRPSMMRMACATTSSCGRGLSGMTARNSPPPTLLIRS